jgi:hypothetical protein
MAFRLFPPVDSQQLEIPDQQFQPGAGQAGQAMDAGITGSHFGRTSK